MVRSSSDENPDTDLNRAIALCLGLAVLDGIGLLALGVG